MLFGLVSGYVFDIVGAQKASCAGGLLASVCLLVVGFAVDLDSEAWPITQVVLLTLGLFLADVGGMVASLGILGWMWHYPRAQALIMGLSNATYQISGVLGLLFDALLQQGYSLADGFRVVAVLSALSGV